VNCEDRAARSNCRIEYEIELRRSNCEDRNCEMSQLRRSNCEDRRTAKIEHKIELRRSNYEDQAKIELRRSGTE
jgi:hypothetical protein